MPIVILANSMFLYFYSLTKWSRHEPAALKRMDKGHTDHWSKTKHKTVTLFTSGKDSKTHFFPGERFPHEEVPTRKSWHTVI